MPATSSGRAAHGFFSLRASNAHSRVQYFFWQETAPDLYLFRWNDLPQFRHSYFRALSAFRSLVASPDAFIACSRHAAEHNFWPWRVLTKPSPHILHGTLSESLTPNLHLSLQNSFLVRGERNASPHFLQTCCLGGLPAMFRHVLLHRVFVRPCAPCLISHPQTRHGTEDGFGGWPFAQAFEQYLRGLTPSDGCNGPPQVWQRLPSLVHPPLTHSGCTCIRLPEEMAG